MGSEMCIRDSDDVVLIAGKGHENTQEINGHKNVFDDRDFVKNLLGLTD